MKFIATLIAEFNLQPNAPYRSQDVYHFMIRCTHQLVDICLPSHILLVVDLAVLFMQIYRDFSRGHFAPCNGFSPLS